MKTKNDGGPAFPCSVAKDRETNELIPLQIGNDDFKMPGMSLRDYFAGQALMGLLSNPVVFNPETMTSEEKLNLLNSFAFKFADEQIKAREGEG